MGLSHESLILDQLGESLIHFDEISLQRCPDEGETGRAGGTSAAPTSSRVWRSQAVLCWRSEPCRQRNPIRFKRALPPPSVVCAATSARPARPRRRSTSRPIGGTGDDAAGARPTMCGAIRSSGPSRSPPPGTGMAGRGAIPMTPFPRMQTPQELAAPRASPSDDPKDEETETLDAGPRPSRSRTCRSATRRRSKSRCRSRAPCPPSRRRHRKTACAGAMPAGRRRRCGGRCRRQSLARMMRGPGQPGSPRPGAARSAGRPAAAADQRATDRHDTESSATRRRRRNRRLLAAAAVIVVVALGAWLWTKRRAEHAKCR